MKKNRHAFVLVLNEKNWYKIVEQSQSGQRSQVFFRKNSVAPVSTGKLLFYVKKPIKEILGSADFIERKTGDRDELWREFGKESCFESYNEYLDFIEDQQTVTVVRFSNFRILEAPVSADEFRRLIGLPIAPRGGRYLDFEQIQKLLQ